MKKWSFLISVAFALWLISYGVSSAAVISEIMYDLEGGDTGREWVEVYNDTSTDLDLSTWRFLENGVNHTLNHYGGPLSVSAGSYAIIADNAMTFSSEHPSVSVSVFDSSFSLGNTGELLALVNDAGTTIDSVTYDPSIGAAGDGNSLQLVSSWIAATPTPGAVNNSGSGSTSGGSSGGGSGSLGSSSSASTSTQSKSTSVGVTEPFRLELMVESTLEPQRPYDFDLVVHDSNRHRLNSGKYIWSMGDGTRYGFASNQEVYHAYEHAGSYVVYVEYYRSELLDDPSATLMQMIYVVEPEVHIGGITEGSVIIENGGGEFVDLGTWKLVSSGEMISIVRGTFIAPRSSTIITEPFSFHPKLHRIDLLSPTGEVASTYNPVEVMYKAIEESVRDYGGASVISSGVPAMTQNVSDTIYQEAYQAAQAFLSDNDNPRSVEKEHIVSYRDDDSEMMPKVIKGRPPMGIAPWMMIVGTIVLAGVVLCIGVYLVRQEKQNQHSRGESAGKEKVSDADFFTLVEEEDPR